MKVYLFLVRLLWLFCGCYCNDTAIDVDFYSVEKGLIDSIKENYDPSIRPWIAPKQLKTSQFLVFVEFWLHALLEIDEKGETMTTSMAIGMHWEDAKTYWDPSEYENITYIYIQAKHVWRPLWFITNSVDRDSVVRFEDWEPIKCNCDGWVFWQRMNTIKTSCSIDTTYFPFDKQVCSVDMHWYEYQVIAFHIDRNYSERFKFYKDNGLWELIGYDVVTNELKIPSYKVVYTFKRKPDYIIYNVLFPVLLIALLGPLVFLLPAESGERVSYSITVLLTVSVYMTIISDYLPNSSRPMAYMIYGLFSLEVFCAIIVVVVIFTTKVYHYNPNIQVPRSLIIFINLFRCCGVCKRVYLIMRDGGRRLFRIDTTQMEQRDNTTLNIGLNKENTLDKEESYDNYVAEDIEIDAGNENLQDEMTWAEIAIALDRIALYTFYIVIMIVVVVSVNSVYFHM